MFGLPGQELDDWRRSVDAAVALAPEHVSAYALTIERGTPFGALDRAGQLPRAGDDAVAAMFQAGRQALAAAGLAHYEVSSYARPGRRARHNSLYWQAAGAAYLGAGASASSFRPLADGGGLALREPARDRDLPARGTRRRRQPGPGARRTPHARRSRERSGLAGPTHRRRRRPRRPSAPLRPRRPRRSRGGVAACVRAGWLEVSDARVGLADRRLALRRRGRHAPLARRSRPESSETLGEHRRRVSRSGGRYDRSARRRSHQRRPSNSSTLCAATGCGTRSR